ncbi:putative NADH-flavin reductase [Microbacteriaceae bacterium SG_E_30_P1]|uniref:NADH-flavin reductase n=1 Tax=Antiquaquibacter oligotrophicus TaxID=2880260 RepID=A0ABT6KMW1_9MICO|nr:NAD(P)H-binding protein [Antiquaquibacter oligotrophicus]MDH6180773.1 putative NADH-flavin reductase [Antiquaquibacter oligotrophicus]UDF13508.1 NAD(P)H-binding protein [Antiquaquibacter oligotrophicus]
MTLITVLGGTGYAGAAIVAEAAGRGHQVKAVSRTAPEAPVEGVDYVAGSALDTAILDQVLPGSDVVIIALSPRGDMAGKLEGVIESVAQRLQGTPTRLGYVGGASSLQTQEGGPTLWDVSKEHIPADVKPEIETGIWALNFLRATPDTLDWFYVSPPENFGSWLGTPSKGDYALGGDVLLRDEDGNSVISAADLALAVLDEVETPQHRRARFTAIH